MVHIRRRLYSTVQRKWLLNTWTLLRYSTDIRTRPLAERSTMHWYPEQLSEYWLDAYTWLYTVECQGGVLGLRVRVDGRAELWRWPAMTGVTSLRLCSAVSCSSMCAVKQWLLHLDVRQPRALAKRQTPTRVSGCMHRPEQTASSRVLR